jgi:alpha-L-fucosidase
MGFINLPKLKVNWFADPSSQKIFFSKLLLTTIFTIISICFNNSAYAQKENETYHARMKWWNEGRLGLFLHWGIYSTYGGEYKGVDFGKEMGGASAEWIYLKANIPKEEYREAAKRFNPTKFNAAHWVKMAKDAGMKYMVLTSKHHDGFALFNTKASDWNAVQSSGIQKDLIKEYVDACHEQGIRVGFYYSHEKDWFNHSRTTRDTGPLPEKYKTYVKTQIKELFTQYGQIDLIWFDTPVKEHEEFNRECAEMVRKLQPDCIVNGRIGNNLGDYKNIGDRAIVDPGETGYMESIMTMRLNWGYDKNDDFWKSSKDLIEMVSKSACRGSNFLLNVGPTPEGSFTPEDQVRLHNLGEWMKLNGEAIYKTNGSPFNKEHQWGSMTTKKENKTVYLHLWNWQGGSIIVKGLKSEVLNAHFLDNGQNVQTIVDFDNALITVILPNYNEYDKTRIVRLTLKEDIKFEKNLGPDYSGKQIHHVTHQRIYGKITEIKGINFTIQGRRFVSGQNDYEIVEEKVTTKTLSLIDFVRFRINQKGDIKLVQGYELEKEKEYAVVYSPYEDGPVLEIITEIR